MILSSPMAELNELTFEISRIEAALEFTARVLPTLRTHGWEIEITSKWPYQIEEGEARLSVETVGASGETFGGYGWFDLGFKVEVAGQNPRSGPADSCISGTAG